MSVEFGSKSAKPSIQATPEGVSRRDVV